MTAIPLRAPDDGRAPLKLYPTLCLECRKPTRGRALCKAHRRSPRVCLKHGIPLLCKGCGRPAVCRPRQLCYRCGHNPRVLALVPAEPRRDGSHVVPERGAERKLPPPPWPTATRPGTAARRGVLRWRAEHGYLLHHPGDRSLLLARLMEIWFEGGQS